MPSCALSGRPNFLTWSALPWYPAPHKFLGLPMYSLYLSTNRPASILPAASNFMLRAASTCACGMLYFLMFSALVYQFRISPNVSGITWSGPLAPAPLSFVAAPKLDSRPYTAKAAAGSTCKTPARLRICLVSAFSKILGSIGVNCSMRLSVTLAELATNFSSNFLGWSFPPTTSGAPVAGCSVRDSDWRRASRTGASAANAA